MRCLQYDPAVLLCNSLSCALCPRPFSNFEYCTHAHSLNSVPNEISLSLSLPLSLSPSSIDMYNNDVGKKSVQKFMKQTGALKAATLYFAS